MRTYDLMFITCPRVMPAAAASMASSAALQ
jgi:hypothetical protein